MANIFVPYQSYPALDMPAAGLTDGSSGAVWVALPAHSALPGLSTPTIRLPMDPDRAAGAERWAAIQRRNIRVVQPLAIFLVFAAIGSLYVGFWLDTPWYIPVQLLLFALAGTVLYRGRRREREARPASYPAQVSGGLLITNVKEDVALEWARRNAFVSVQPG
ncbi:hypothetical protein AB0J83_01695 [Actinoplanes sp. NPDC049596]|uniref:hypothetical protein n=1 Tax=unclassified Actinoplanes TaxID=2626549 RepID=UPI00344558D0